MKDKLKLEIEKEMNGKGSKVGISVSSDVKSHAGLETEELIPLIGKCNAYKELEKEVSKIKEELDALLAKARTLFDSEIYENEVPDVHEDMSAEQIWNILTGIRDFDVLLLKFNGMSHEKRLEVADYVFTHGNIFSGPASDFSARYNSEKGILE